MKVGLFLSEIFADRLMEIEEGYLIVIFSWVAERSQKVLRNEIIFKTRSETCAGLELAHK